MGNDELRYITSISEYAAGVAASLFGLLFVSEADTLLLKIVSIALSITFFISSMRYKSFVDNLPTNSKDLKNE